MNTLRTAAGLDLHLHAWPVSGPQAAVALLHGYGEHAGRYDHVARAFNDRGIAVYAVDLRGHGRSPGSRAHVDAFTDYHRDADALVLHVKERHPGVPLFVFAHSMGALVYLHWALAGRGQDLRGVCLSSPFLGIQIPVSGAKAAAGRFLSKVLPKMGLPSGLNGAAVTRDPEMAKKYDSDPLMNKNAGARWFTEAMAAIDKVLSQAHQLERPLILLYGGDDRVANPDATDKLVAKLTMKDRTVERLPGHYHELVNEPLDIRNGLIRRYGDWILEKAKNP